MKTRMSKKTAKVPKELQDQIDRKSAYQNQLYEEVKTEAPKDYILIDFLSIVGLSKDLVAEIVQKFE